MSTEERCPKCYADFDGGPIPEEQRQYYAPPYRWSTLIHEVDRDQDRVVAFRCPYCKHRWPR